MAPKSGILNSLYIPNQFNLTINASPMFRWDDNIPQISKYDEGGSTKLFH